MEAATTKQSVDTTTSTLPILCHCLDVAIAHAPSSSLELGWGGTHLVPATCVTLLVQNIRMAT